ncbi:putative kielin/chordin-like protein [Apostichopus japonicus]|uniref:Putative kielin/chordin-like protein n=2 Tax=Stichopus japonicus TaxID=307972 RepID=A0A2G8KQH8_STIJA|nr:putative kielin/chordin-like protein [Apostichopus japonicus]
MATCIVFGDPHYRTFDGHFLEFQGTCSYLMAKDCVSESFEVVAQNDGKGTYEASWTRLISFRFFNYTIDLLPNFEVAVNGQRVTLPFLAEPLFSVQKLGLLLYLHTNIGVRVSWDGNHFAEVAVDSIWKDQMCGLCGNYNGDSTDDFM